MVISEVGVSDAMRSEFSPNGPPNIPEFGSVTTEPGFKGLYEMDAYQHVHDGVKYPSVLLTTGLNDPRVASWEPTKMTARLQAATASNNPVPAPGRDRCRPRHRLDATATRPRDGGHHRLHPMAHRRSAISA